MRQEPYRLAIYSLNETHDGMGGVLLSFAERLVVPQRRVAHTGHPIARVGVLDELRDAGQVGGRHRTYAVRLRLPILQARDVRPITYAPTLESQRHLIAELTVIPGDTGDRLQALVAFGTPLMEHLKLRAHQAATAICRGCAYYLRSPDTKRDPIIRPGLRNQDHGRGDRPGADLLDDSKIVCAAGGMVPAQEILRPGRNAHIGLLRASSAEYLSIESGQRLGVVWRRTAQNKPIAQVAQDCVCLGPAVSHDTLLMMYAHAGDAW